MGQMKEQLEEQNGTRDLRTYLQQEGRTIVSPVTGSMRPLIRPQRDFAILQVPDAALRKYDVVLYSRGEKMVLHRIIAVQDGSYITRGDAASGRECIAREQIFGVMEGLYHGARYISCASVPYRLLSRLLVAGNPAFRCWRALRRRLSAVPCLKRLYRKVKRNHEARA